MISSFEEPYEVELRREGKLDIDHTEKILRTPTWKNFLFYRLYSDQYAEQSPLDKFYGNY